MNNSKAQDFWDKHTRFLNHIPTTEQPNPLSYNLSALCTTDIKEAFSIFNTIEQQAITSLQQYLPQISLFQKDVQKVLQNNHRVFLIGCGASGRLSVLLKRLWDLYYPDRHMQIVAVAAGGDISLIKSIEQFEDKEEFGIQQLLAQGYTAKDLVIGLSASGESPFILSALNYASNISCHKPYLICNTESNTSITSAQSGIHSLNLDVGSMALTGSTRLQATTAMQVACAIALFNKNPERTIKSCQSLIKNIDFNVFSEITKLEADILKRQEYILYSTNDTILGLSLLADTTERSPTFNLPTFENQNQLPPNNFSPFYVNIDTINTADSCWQKLLGHAPTCLNWSDFSETSPEYIHGFDLSKNSKRASAKYLPHPQYHQYWHIQENTLTIDFLTTKFTTDIPIDFFERTILYKLLLNSHSTILMGRLGYFYGNLMITLKPSNHKLIDRAIRYAIFILKTMHQQDVAYKTVANALFQEIEQLQPNESIVMKVVNSIIQNKL